MEKIDALFISEINRVLTTFPSIYSNNDVVSLLENLKISIIDELSKTKPIVGITEEQFQEFNSNVRYALERVLCDSNEFVDHSSVEFNIDYDNRVSIQNIDINTDYITEELDEIMLDRFQEAFGELIINNEQQI
jgi:hypothetical protein